MLCCCMCRGKVGCFSASSGHSERKWLPGFWDLSCNTSSIACVSHEYSNEGRPS